MGGELFISKEHLDDIKNNLKIVEGRPRTWYNDHIKVGDSIIFKCGRERLRRIVSGKICYLSFGHLLAVQGLGRVLPREKTIQNGIKLYYNFNNYREYEKKYGVLALHLKVGTAMAMEEGELEKTNDADLRQVLDNGKIGKAIDSVQNFGIASGVKSEFIAVELESNLELKEDDMKNEYKLCIVLDVLKSTDK